LNLPPRERRPRERSAFRRFLANLQEDNTSRHTVTAVLADPIEQVHPYVEVALRDEGSGVLTENDVATTTPGDRPTVVPQHRLIPL